MYSYYAFFENEEILSLIDLKALLCQYFSHRSGFVVDIKHMAPLKMDYLLAEYETWRASVYCEIRSVDSARFESFVEQCSASGDERARNSKYMIRVVLKSDDPVKYTNEDIWMVEFLEERGCSSIYDPQKDEFF